MIKFLCLSVLLGWAMVMTGHYYYNANDGYCVGDEEMGEWKMMGS